MNEETKLLLRHLDGDLAPDEEQGFRRRLMYSPRLRRQLAEMRQVGAFVRQWADTAGQRAETLLEPTLARVHAAQRERRRHAAVTMALAAVLVAAWPWSGHSPWATPTAFADRVMTVAGSEPRGAAIERLEAGDHHALVFVLGSSSTPVVWLADDVGEGDDSSGQQGPG